MSKTREDYIKDFHSAFSHSVESEPSIKILTLRKNLIAEETRELIEEIDSAISELQEGKQIEKEHHARLLKEMADVQVVLSGTAVSLKPLMRFDEAFLRVHESNMSKLDKDGKPIFREDGKILKGPDYKKPDLLDLVIDES